MEEAEEPTKLRSEWVPPLISIGAGGERMYSAVRVGTDTFHVNDTVIVRVDGFGNDQVARIEALWEDVRGAKWWEGRWYYTPEETTCGRLVGHDPRELFETAHVDENLVDTIDCHCTVMEWDAYQRWLDQPAEDDDEEETTFACRAMYHAGSGEFVPLTGASTLAEAARIGGRQLQLHSAPPAADAMRAAPQYAPKSFRGELGSSSLPALGAGRKRRLGRFSEAAARLAPSAVPERMPCREKERAEVIATLRAAVLEGALGGSLYISGTPGTGKTATVHQALRELTADRTLQFRSIFVNGMKMSTPFQVYALLWEGLTGQAVKPSRALELLERRFAAPVTSRLSFSKAVQQRRKGASEKVILILDELDYLVTSRQSVLYNLFEWSTRANAALVVVGISNTMDLPERLLPRVESRLNIRRVNFHPYDRSALESIITDRLGTLDAFAAGDGGLELCARKVASVTGDVRRALEVCRLATQIAEREEAAAHSERANDGGKGAARQAPTHVTIAHIEEAHKQLRGSALLLAVQGAPPQLKLMLAAMVLLLERTGRAEVDRTALRGRHRDLCERLYAPEDFPVLQIPEQNEAIARLCAARLLEPAGSAAIGTLRLTAPLDDVKHYVREHPRLEHLFPR
jgi:origin recognition complex subunit 1